MNFCQGFAVDSSMLKQEFTIDFFQQLLESIDFFQQLLESATFK